MLHLLNGKQALINQSHVIKVLLKQYQPVISCMFKQGIQRTYHLSQTGVSHLALLVIKREVRFFVLAIVQH